MSRTVSNHARVNFAWALLLALAFLLQGCIASTPIRQRGEGTQRLVAGSEAEVRAGMHAIFTQMGSDFAIVDQGELVQASYLGTSFALRYKALLAAGTDPGTTNVEMFCELPGSVKAEAIRECEANFLKGLAESVEYARLKKTAAAPLVAPPAAGVVPGAAMADVDTLPALRVPRADNRYAIVIGLERYRQKLPPADFAGRDAETVAAYLTKVLGYPEENVVILLNDRALQSDLTKYFEKWLPNNVEPGATVFVYYSGHGAPNPQTGDAYLVPYDGDPAFIDETGYSLKRMYAALGKLPAREIVVALDSCFSGAGGRSVLAAGTRSITLNLKNQATLPANLTVLAASAGEQTSSTYAEKGHGLFTYFLLKGIKNEEVVAPDGSLRLDDLFAYLQPQVERVARKQYNNEQTPQLLGVGR